MIKTFNKAVLGRNFQTSYVTSVRVTKRYFFVKREMPTLFPVNCERTNFLFSVKRKFDPLFATLYFLKMTVTQVLVFDWIIGLARLTYCNQGAWLNVYLD